MSPYKLIAYPKSASLALLLLRIGAGGMLALGHGFGKLAHFSELAPKFADPIGVGTTATLILAVFSEFFCGIAVMVGAATRIAALFPLVTMLIAAGMVHSADPWAKKELALLYGIQFLVIFLTGPGAFSLDAVMEKVRNR